MQSNSKLTANMANLGSNCHIIKTVKEEIVKMLRKMYSLLKLTGKN